jgi:hypothetical protein
MRPSPLAFPARFLKKSAAVSNDTHLFRDGRSNPLVQGDAVLFREALGGLLDGVWKLQWISSSTHGFTYHRISQLAR